MTNLRKIYLPYVCVQEIIMTHSGLFIHVFRLLLYCQLRHNYHTKVFYK
jgi:hypothetical protein